MSMIQIVIGTALGYFVGHGVLLGLKQLLSSRPADGVRDRIGRVIPAAWMGGFTRYAALVGASAAVIVLGVWEAGDYMAARAARTAAASTFDPAAAAAVDAHGPANEGADAAAMTTQADASPAPVVHEIDPYADPEYRVHRREGSASLKDKLLQRAEAKAGNELLRDMKQHAQRSQYDCEAAVHAAKYLKARLDVWGFAAWHSKYFPLEGYKGATLDQCTDIKDVVEPSALDLKSTVAQGNRS